MGSRTKLTGRVIGHTVKFLPKKVDHRGGGVTITKERKLGATLTLQVDGKKTYTVSSRKTEVIFGAEEPPEPTDIQRIEVFNTLVERHPFNAERTFIEEVTPRSKGQAFRKYELEE
jgi:hypothetical protein